VQPGEKEKLHNDRWPSILVQIGTGAVEDFDARGNPLTGLTVPDNFAWPTVLMMPPEATHAVSNPGTSKAFRLVRIEFNHGFPKP
jgi:hypothetical protein